MPAEQLRPKLPTPLPNVVQRGFRQLGRELESARSQFFPCVSRNGVLVMAREGWNMQGDEKSILGVFFTAAG